MKMQWILLGMATCLSCSVLAQTESSAASGMVQDQEAMMEVWQAAATPGEPHERLAEMAGEWTGQVETWAVPGMEPMVSVSSVVREMTLDGRVIEERWSGEMMGMPFQGHGRTGYNNVTEDYWSTWTDNVSTGLMTFTGQYDAESDRYEFTGSYVDPVSKQTVDTRSVSHSPESGKEIMEMFETRGGEEIMTMRITLTKN